MPWAAIGSAALGAYGAYKSSKDRPDVPDPYETARANFNANNFDRYTPFGNVRYGVQQGNPKDPSDDRYFMEQQYSPEMQGLLDVMMGRAGATPATFQSNMPQGVQDRMSSVFGSEVQRPTYSAPQMAFGYDGGPAVAREPEASGAPSGVSAGQFEVTPGQTTNRDTVSQAFQTGLIDESDYNWFQRMFEESGDVAGQTNWGGAGNASTLINELGNTSNGLAPENRERMERLFNALYPGNYGAPNPDYGNSEVPASNYDSEALEELLSALSAGGRYGA